MYDLHLRVNPQKTTLGWYTAGLGVSPSSAPKDVSGANRASVLVNALNVIKRLIKMLIKLYPMGHTQCCYPLSNSY